MSDFTIHTKQDMIDAIESYGILPFFANEIPGYSIEEHCAPEAYFSDQPGVWDWKGPVIQEMRCAYGKFFRGKAVFIRKDLFREFANWRRDGYDFDARFEDGLASYDDRHLYNIIESHRSVLSKEAKVLGGYVKPKDKGRDTWEPRKGFDSRITKLQMQCYIVTSDFEYETDKNGNFYGWGIARYTTPENFFGRYFTNGVYKHTPEESHQKILRHMKKKLPRVGEAAIEHLLRF